MRGTGHPADKVGGDPVDPRIHLLCKKSYEDGWIAGSSPAMTALKSAPMPTGTTIRS